MLTSYCLSNIMWKVLIYKEVLKWKEHFSLRKGKEAKFTVLDRECLPPTVEKSYKEDVEKVDKFYLRKPSFRKATSLWRVWSFSLSVIDQTLLSMWSFVAFLTIFFRRNRFAFYSIVKEKPSISFGLQSWKVDRQQAFGYVCFAKRNAV